MAYQATKETFDRPVNATWNPALNAGLGGWEGGSFPDAVETGRWLTVLETLQDVVGLAGADPGSGSHEARLNRLEGDHGSHFSVQDGDAASPLLGDLQVRTDLVPWQLFGFGPDCWACPSSGRTRRRTARCRRSTWPAARSSGWTPAARRRWSTR